MNKDLSKAKQSDNGKWVDGFCIYIHERVYIICEAETECIDGENTDLYATEWYEVDPETVCKCTGKEYMDGSIAYEGDIFENPECGVIFVLKYGTYKAYCPADNDYMDNVGFYAEADGYPQMPIGDLSTYALKIGNIFDNPIGEREEYDENASEYLNRERISVENNG